jgi:hypothetical protein
MTMSHRLNTPQVPMETPEQRRAAVQRIQRRALAVRLGKITARVERLALTAAEESRHRQRHQAAELVALVLTKQFAGTNAGNAETKRGTRRTTKRKTQ